MENVVERAVNFCDGNTIKSEHLPDSLLHWYNKGGGLAPVRLRPHGLGNTLMETEKEIIVETLRETRGNKSLAAQRLNINRSALYRKMQKYNIGP
ncbi:MAG: helix-turn-helix domain-containing protein [Chitinophagales bacterium]